MYYREQDKNIESSPVWDTSRLAELIYNLINKQFSRGNCSKPVTIQYLQTGQFLLFMSCRESHEAFSFSPLHECCGAWATSRKIAFVCVAYNTLGHTTYMYL